MVQQGWALAAPLPRLFAALPAAWRYSPRSAAPRRAEAAWRQCPLYPQKRTLISRAEEWHTALRNSGRANRKGGLAPRTIGHAHRVLSKALSDAVENEVITKNVATTKVVPKVPDDEMVIVRDVAALIDKLRT